MVVVPVKVTIVQGVHVLFRQRVEVLPEPFVPSLRVGKAFALAACSRWPWPRNAPGRNALGRFRDAVEMPGVGALLSGHAGEVIVSGKGISVIAALISRAANSLCFSLRESEKAGARCVF